MIIENGEWIIENVKGVLALHDVISRRGQIIPVSKNVFHASKNAIPAHKNVIPAKAGIWASFTLPVSHPVILTKKYVTPNKNVIPAHKNVIPATCTEHCRSKAGIQSNDAQAAFLLWQVHSAQTEPMNQKSRKWL